MTSENDGGVWYATQTASDGTTCIGFSPVLHEAMDYCLDLLTARKTKHGNNTTGEDKEPHAQARK